ncbi:MAG: LexA family protein [bacterium]
MTQEGRPLTPQQSEVLLYIQKYIDENGYAPLYREIQTGAGLTNVGLVHKNLTALEKKGYIDRQENTKRGIELTEIGEQKDLSDIPPAVFKIEYKRAGFWMNVNLFIL